MIDFDSVELDHLLNDLLSDRLSENDAKRLELILSESQAARMQYYLYLDVDTALKREHSADHDFAQMVEILPNLQEFGVSKPSGRWKAIGVVGLLTGLAAVIMFMLFNWPPPSGSPPLMAETGPDTQFAATVVRLENASGTSDVGPLKVRQRVPTGEVRLESGKAMLQLDNGARLNLEGPASLEILSSSKAKLREGTVSVQCPASALGFELEGPGASVIDLGTEFGMSATSDGTDIHVFDGEVAWQSLSNKEHPRLLESGRAVRVTQVGDEAIPFQVTSFERDFSMPIPIDGDSEDATLCYEGFAYDAGSLGMSDGGEGWGRGWRRASTDKPIGLKVLDDDSLHHSKSGVADGGRLQLKGFKRAWRQLAQPIRMDRNGTTYFSFLLHKTGPDNPNDPVTAMVVLGSDENAKAMVGVGVNELDQVFLLHCGNNVEVSETIVERATCFFVVKIDARDTLSDELSVALFWEDDSVPEFEPVTWALRGTSRSGDESLNHLILQNKRGAIFELDEIRIGTSWKSVTASESRKK
ncbi:FecR protein [Rubripirellula tenax]|uniref:FecR protein n=1 Tax=Rubripirellula tenax TaxID=2528015 RepID=A0A5C6FBT9_9BACT|nr:FecR domain-containing protein [Rubripirellula tenax]TWU58868.1 FecR protein [Rubripirellula tenax]